MRWQPSERGEKRRLTRIGVQLYTVRAEMGRDPDSTRARVAEIGYKEVEFARYFGLEPTVLRCWMLDRHGLTAPSAHVPIESLRDGWGRTLEDAHTLGHRYLACPWIPERERTLDGYKRLAELFNRAGQEAARAGIRFCYHNDAHVFARVDGVVPYDLLLMECKPENVAMQMDVFWFRKAGQDPLLYLARHPRRRRRRQALLRGARRARRSLRQHPRELRIFARADVLMPTFRI